MNLDKLRALCMSFPGATEGVKWEDHICFMVAEKIFVITGAEGGVSFKVQAEEVEELTEREGIVPTPYMARNNWVTVQQYNKMRPQEWDRYIRQSYEIIRSRLPKKIQSALK